MMTMPRTMIPLAALALAPFALLAAAQQQAAPQQGARAAPPLVQWTGAHSKKTEAGFVLVRDDAAWRTLWAEHEGARTDEPYVFTRHAAPKIDFDRCLVVAYFAGKRTNQDGAVAEAVEQVGGATRLRFHPSTFQTAGPGGGAQSVTPYAMWVIPATNAPVVIEEARRSLKDEPVRWEEVKRFGAR
ncbi:MAG: hypothetical protein WD749_13380 [Phycisphaerales bacterium]